MGFLDFMSDAFGAGWTWLAGQQGAGLSYKHQKALMDKQYNLSMKGTKQNLLNNYVYARQGLEKAGYNPIIAGGNVAGATNAFSAGSAPSTNMPNYTDSTNALNFNLNRKATQAQTNTTNAQGILFNEQAKTEQAKRTNLEFQNRMLDVEKHLKQKNLDTYDRRFYTELYEQMQRAENYRAMANVQGYNAETQRIAANAQQMKASTEREISTYDKQRYLEWKKRHPYQEGFLYGAGQYTSTLGKIFSGNASVSAKR